jgi:hypothetical protein
VSTKFSKTSQYQISLNMFGGSRVVKFRQRDGWMDGQADTEKLIGAFLVNLVANAPENFLSAREQGWSEKL